MVKVIHPTKGRKRKVGIISICHIHDWMWNGKAVVCYSCGAKKKEG